MINPKVKPAEDTSLQEPSKAALAALEAMKRAAIKARKRNIALLGSVVTYRDGKIVYDTEP